MKFTAKPSRRSARRPRARSIIRLSATACGDGLALVGRVALRLAGLLASGARTRGCGCRAPAAAPRMEFTPLPPGSYRLQPIQPVADATLLDERGEPVQLSALTQGKITLLTFFYTYCVDPLGCPFAHETLTQLRDRIARGHGAGAQRALRRHQLRSDERTRRTVHRATTPPPFTRRSRVRMAIPHRAPRCPSCCRCWMISGRT